MRPLQVNGLSAEKAILRPNDRITLGVLDDVSGAVSATRAGERLGPNRPDEWSCGWPQAVDGVILMAETLLLGSGSQVHVPMPDLRRQLVLFRQKDGLGVRYSGAFTIDGERVQERGSLRPGSTVTGEDFSFALEPLGSG